MWCSHRKEPLMRLLMIFSTLICFGQVSVAKDLIACGSVRKFEGQSIPSFSVPSAKENFLEITIKVDSQNELPPFSAETANVRSFRKGEEWTFLSFHSEDRFESIFK